MSMGTGKCVHCGKPKGEHKATTFHCPVGRRTRIGQIHFHAMQVFEETMRWTTFMPKYPTCPFRRGQTIAHKKGLAETKESVRRGLPFFCHKTVYIGDALAGARAAEAGDTSRQRPQSEWRECCGALDYRERCNLAARRALAKKKTKTP